MNAPARSPRFQKGDTVYLPRGKRFATLEHEHIGNRWRVRLLDNGQWRYLTTDRFEHAHRSHVAQHGLVKP